jgi:hypothetical protein
MLLTRVGEIGSQKNQIDDNELTGGRGDAMGDYSRHVAAYHEAGHAIMAAVLGKPIDYVDIQPDDGTPPVTYYRAGPLIETEILDERTRGFIVREIKIALAGITAHNRYTRHPRNIVGEFDDLKKASEWAAYLASGEEAFRLVQETREEVEGFFNDPRTWRAVDCLAGLLIRERRVDGRKVPEIVRSSNLIGDATQPMDQ